MSLNDFEKLTRIGSGSYSSVYKVQRIEDDKQYALKKVKMSGLSNKEKENALNEVRFLASINHPNVISYKEVFIDHPSSSLCIIMEYADNGDLLEKIQKHKKNGSFIPEDDILSIFVQVVSGLSRIHQLNVMHRDLKSANVFLNKDGRAQLGDLNVSKLAQLGMNYTQTGTPYYASPEVWKEKPYDFKSDIWSLGCVLYEIAALKPPFKAKNMSELYKRVSKGTFAPIPKVYSKNLLKVICCLVKRSPSLRPSCQEIMDEVLPKNGFESYVAKYTYQLDKKDSLLGTIRFSKNWKLKQIKEKLPKSNYRDKHVESYDNLLYHKENNSVSLTRNNDTMISQSTMQSSSLVENPVIPQNRYLAVSSIKATRSDGHNRNSSLSKLKIDRQMTHRDYGDITKDYTNPDTLKNNPNITSKPIKQRHKRTDLNLLRLSKLKNDKKSSMKRYLELKDNSKISLMPKIPRITGNYLFIIVQKICLTTTVDLTASKRQSLLLVIPKRCSLNYICTCIRRGTVFQIMESETTDHIERKIKAVLLSSTEDTTPGREMTTKVIAKVYLDSE
ncbi:unnamed protein product [Moneuplotes crassus]|uniref:non-specific serine/threonine protein kinase n=1 Tax=Euplotes crassus TaxID=5936 RepID=A0AAD1U6B8_EUPCR|nr:unnamed protein product [Moneuplotes crassus]